MGTAVDDFLAEMLPQQVAAETAIHNGDVAPRLALWSRNDPVTVFGAKRSATGWADLEPMFHTVASWFSDSTEYDFEVVAAGASGDLAYTVGYEHNRVKVDGEPTHLHPARHPCVSARARSVAHRAPTRRLPAGCRPTNRAPVDGGCRHRKPLASGGQTEADMGTEVEERRLRSPKGRRRSTSNGIGCRCYCRWRPSGACHESGVDQGRAGACGS